ASPSRASTFLSAGIASSRLPSRMSVFWAISGSLAAIFAFEGSKKWITRDGFTGISGGGVGAPMASGLPKSRGLRIGRVYRAPRGRVKASHQPRSGNRMLVAPQVTPAELPGIEGATVHESKH